MHIRYYKFITHPILPGKKKIQKGPFTIFFSTLKILAGQHCFVYFSQENSQKISQKKELLKSE